MTGLFDEFVRESEKPHRVIRGNAFTGWQPLVVGRIRRPWDVTDKLTMAGFRPVCNARREGC
jgi:hypothetical protein